MRHYEVISETGRTIGEYVTLASRERACALLSTTDLPVHAIATQVGFSSAASFSYAFRKATGIRPTDLRKNVRLLDRPPRRSGVVARDRFEH